MSSRRVLKVAEAIREVVSMAILTELRDPRIEHVTVTYVEVSGDLRHAKVHVSIMGDERKEQLALHGLESARGFLQKKVGDRLDTKYVPRLKFALDKGVKHSLAVARILDEVLPEDSDADVEFEPAETPETLATGHDNPTTDEEESTTDRSDS